MEKIKKLSLILKWTFTIAAYALPLINAGFWITEGYTFLKPWLNLNFIPFEDAVLKPLHEMSPQMKYGAFLISLIPTVMNMLALACVARLFQLFSEMQIFSESSVKCIRRVGYLILSNQVIFPLYMALLSFTLTFSNPEGERVIKVGFGIDQLGLIIIGAVVILVSWVMEEGRKLKEQEFIV